MGITHARIAIENTFNKRRVEADALVDSGSVFFTMPAHLAIQLGFDLEEVVRRVVILADGTRKAAPMIGPIRIHYADRYCDLSALVLGEEPLLGAVPMEMMDLILHPTTQTLSVNPANPFLPGTLAKIAA